jgi:5-methylcytosine-specific restriction endonuclease McrA
LAGWKSAEQRIAYYKANREKAYNWRKSWKEANPEKVLENQKIYYQKHAEQERMRVSVWKKANPEKVNAYRATRKAIQNKVNDIYTSDDKWLLAEFYSLAKLREEVLGFKWHVDHIVPLSKGGRHCLTNLQVVPEHWNLSKGNRNTDIFIGATTGENDDKDSARDT